MAPSSGLRSWFTSPAPDVAVEVTARGVAAVALGRGNGTPVVSRQASAALPAGALVPALNAQNVVDRAGVTGALRQVLDQVGRPRRVGLVVPDPVARLSIVRLDTVPGKAEDRDQLVRFQVRKAAPFPAELAHFSVAPGRPLDGGGQEFVVALARRDVIEEYERACAEAGAHAGIVDLATCSLLTLVTRTAPRAAADVPGDDWMLVHVAPTYSTVAIVRGDTPILFRNRAAEAEGPLADVVHQSAMYYEDRLQGTGFRRVVLVGAQSPDAEMAELERVLGERLGTGVEHVDLRRAVQFADRIDVPPALVAALAPAVGLALREAE
jgi:Tfp pilus assembly PilM family ATPase